MIASDEPQRFIVPIWVMALGAIVIAAAAYIGLSMGLSSQAVELSALVRTLPPASRGDVTRAAPKQDAPEPEAPQPVDFALLPEFKAGAPDNLKGAVNPRICQSNSVMLFIDQ